MKHTVIALFDQPAQAEAAAAALAQRGVDASRVHLARGDFETDVPPAAEVESGPISGLLHRLSMLFGVAEPHLSHSSHYAHYEEAIRRGGVVVQVDADDEAGATAARDALLALGAVNIDDRVEAWKASGWAGPAAASGTAATDAAVVHRDEVSIGGVRVYGYATGTAYEAFAAEFRGHHAARHAGSEAGFEEFDPAYRFGHALANDARYAGRDWADIEREARDEWSRRHPQSAWERARDAVRHAWERVTRS